MLLPPAGLRSAHEVEDFGAPIACLPSSVRTLSTTLFTASHLREGRSRWLVFFVRKLSFSIQTGFIPGHTLDSMAGT